MPSACAGAPTREPRPAAAGPPIPPYPRRADHDPPPVAPPVTPGAGRRNTPQTGIRGCHTISQTPRNPSKPRHDAPLAPDCHKVVTRPRPKTAPWAAVQERRQAVRLTSPDASGVRRTGRLADRPSDDKPMPARLAATRPRPRRARRAGTPLPALRHFQTGMRPSGGLRGRGGAFSRLWQHFRASPCRRPAVCQAVCDTYARATGRHPRGPPRRTG